MSCPTCDHTMASIRPPASMSMKTAREKAAAAWCSESTKSKTMDPELCEQFALILAKERDIHRPPQPFLCSRCGTLVMGDGETYEPELVKRVRDYLTGDGLEPEVIERLRVLGIIDSCMTPDERRKLLRNQD